MALEINTEDFWKEIDKRVVEHRIEKKLMNDEITTLRQRVAELENERDSAYKIADHYRDERDALKQQRDELVVAATKAAEEIRKCDYTPARSTLLVAIASVKEKQNG